mmetsp:Transcript_12429/g.31522  ORF Transcript_12429/g.31522 Transcript_12429/m.31522 type:complete len:85 (-) Transcript_12429:2087-2341(-)
MSASANAGYDFDYAWLRELEAEEAAASACDQAIGQVRYVGTVSVFSLFAPAPALFFAFSSSFLSLCFFLDVDTEYSRPNGRRHR